MGIDEVLERFRRLSLSTYPREEILELFKQAGLIVYIAVSLHEGFSVMRARPNGKSKRFNKISDFSYCPPKDNKKYKRASSPDQTMFYASMIPEHIEPGELNLTRIIGVVETLQHLADQNKCGFEKISFGRWYVIEDIKVIAIVHAKPYYEQSNYTRMLVDAYEKFVETIPSELRDRSLKFHRFLADQYSKEEIEDDYDYLISALFSKVAVDMGFDGVLYPSVRASGRGFNIAITPEATKKLRLEVAGECTLYKRKGRSVVANNAIIELNGDEKEFDLIDVGYDEKIYLNELGINTIEELLDCK